MNLPSIRLLPPVRASRGGARRDRGPQETPRGGGSPLARPNRNATPQSGIAALPGGAASRRTDGGILEPRRRRASRVGGVTGGRVRAGGEALGQHSGGGARSSMAGPESAVHARPWQPPRLTTAGVIRTQRLHVRGPAPDTSTGRAGRRPRRSTPSSSAISRRSSPTRRRPILSATESPHGWSATSGATCAAAFSPTGSLGLAVRTVATSG